MADASTGAESSSPASGQSTPVGRTAALAQDIAELLPSLTIVGLLLVIPRIHHRLIWGNLLGGAILPAKPMAAPSLWAALAIIGDLLLLCAVLIAMIILYMIVNPCEVFANTVIPDAFSFVRPTMESLCPEKLLPKLITK
ncbi:MAG: hypothetical protein HY340_01115 [Candidatus Kerfeldbacteria bacterium]|nr:hypothetical protein [Candidatus Kerfeldbacteria bacterium]